MMTVISFMVRSSEAAMRCRLTVTGRSMSMTPADRGPTTIFCMYMSGADIIAPGPATAMTAIAPPWPLARLSVACSASTARSHAAPPAPTQLPVARSRWSTSGPLPMTTVPLTATLAKAWCMALTAALPAAAVWP